ncbi:hypothetical protein LR48_Vigan09g047300 [Vigna angularis]|uniref:CBM20 domain-containing protein n=2 Tax=Phaseolus angularis TaxID=3914 RepID=A0A0L9VAX9_PHAAN|nr:hypothetical protein LR48_Vigan09g047300 [Vigna angularis]
MCLCSSRLREHSFLHKTTCGSAASSSKSLKFDQVDLETAEPEAKNNEQTIGDDPTLGSWDPLEALSMTWSEGHIWTAEKDMLVGKSIQFKFILKGKEGDIIWQPGSDRVIQTWETVNTITVCEDWENEELQKITEEERLTKPDKEPQIDSEVSASTEILDNPHNELDSNASEIKAVEIPLTAPLTDNSSSFSTEIRYVIVVENIIFHEDLIKNTSSKLNEKIERSEESADSAGNDDIIHDLGNNGSTASLNEEGTVVESSLLFDFEGGPVLVPGLTIPPIEPTNEASQGEKVQEKTSKDISVEGSETDLEQNPNLR